MFTVHIFPSCDFANENLNRIAPDLMHRVADIAHLLIVIATVWALLRCYNDTSKLNTHVQCMHTYMDAFTKPKGTNWLIMLLLSGLDFFPDRDVTYNILT